MARISVFSGDIFENMQWEGHPGVSDSTYRAWWPAYQQARLRSYGGGVLDGFFVMNWNAALKYDLGHASHLWVV